MTRPAYAAELRPDALYRERFIALAGVLWIATPVVAGCGWFWLILQNLGTVGCEGDCREEFLHWPLFVYPWAVGVVIVGAIVAAVVLRSRRRSTVWAPLAAVGLVLLMIVSASALTSYGTAPMYERNERIASGEIRPTDDVRVLPPSPIGSWGTPAAGTPHLELAADGTLRGADGCNEFSGEWMLNADGVAIFRDVVAGAEVCDGVDAWLAYGRSAWVVDGDLWIGDAQVKTIGFLAPA